MKKVYEVKGMMEWHPMFVAGRARIQVSFTGGHFGEGCVTPAKYETSDEVIQRIIESSPAFRSGRIRVAHIEPDPSDVSRKKETQVAKQMAKPKVAAEAKASTAAKKPPVGIFEFDSLDAVRDFLHFEKGVESGKLIDLKGCREQALRLGFDFTCKS